MSKRKGSRDPESSLFTLILRPPARLHECQTHHMSRTWVSTVQAANDRVAPNVNYVPGSVAYTERFFSDFFRLKGV